MSSLLRKGPELSAEEKRALLADLLREKAARDKLEPTSFAQQRLWFLARLEPDSPAYNIPRPLRLRGALNVPALRQTFNQILDRHDVLRGRFELIDGQPMQLIASQLEIDLPVIALQHLSPNEREAEVSRLAIADAEQPFDLSKAPLLRVSLLKLAPDEHVLLLTMHHIVSDGWSMGLLVKEMASIYESISEQQPPALPKPTIQYADFARWQHKWLQDGVLEEQVRYWQQHLNEAPAVLSLPIAKQRPATQTINGSHRSRTLSQKLKRALKELSRQEGVTLFMMLLAAFTTLLYRYSGQDDLVVGTPIAGRNREELEALIGFFVNTLPLRTSLAGNPSFRELLTRVKETSLGAYAHQELPFEKIVEAIQPVRSLSHSPIFQVMFALQNQPRATFTLPGLEVAHLKRDYDTAKFDLSLFMSERDDRLSCWLEYNTDLFTTTSVERLLDHFETLLESIVANPDRSISQMPLLSERERQEILVDWNRTQAEFDGTILVHELFEAQTERTPEATALVAGKERLNYRELNARANQLARYLLATGVGPDQRVGVCLERSADAVIAILATLKAGGAYMPLDLAYPAERLAFTLADSEARVLLTNEALAATVPDTAARKVFLDSEWPVIARHESSNLPRVAHPENLAYVIYTSGSTGRPKGVAIEHRSTATFLQWAMKTFSAAELSSVLLSTSFCFDLSVFELFAPLSVGGKVILVENALQLANLNGEEVTLVNTVPSAMTELVRFGGIPASVQTVNLCGEPLLKSLVDEIYERTQARQVLNLYGPSEDTTYSTYVLAERDVPTEPTIGRPMSNTAAYILDREGQPVPVGVPGELHLSGAGLARGYLNRPELTAEKFIPDPYSGSGGARMYGTGDLARYRADGEIEFLGRIDHQVKLRGYRIELGEIEIALREHDAVEDAVVIAQDSATGRDLVAYVAVQLPVDEQSVTARMRALLRTTLPEYMVPAYFVFLERLPLTPNGKIDRRALPSATRSRADLTESRTTPANKVEQRLARIWKEVLSLDRVGFNDNFFEIGGHSLLAVRLVSEIEKAFGQKLALVSLFRHTTIESQAEALSHVADTSAWPTLVEIQKGDHTIPLFCVSMPNVNALGYVALARSLGGQQAVYGLQAQYPEDLQGEHSQTAVEELATEYLESVREIRPYGPYQFVGMCRGAHIAFEMARRLREEGEEVGLVGILDTWVLENTYNRMLYVEYYAKRLGASFRRGFREWRQKSASTPAQMETASTEPQKNAVARANPMQVYFPGPDFKPLTYPGRVSVFRARSQPFNRIRDEALGWATLATGGVDVHYIPGKHGASVLREPHVRVLAAEIKKRLVDT